MDQVFAVECLSSSSTLIEILSIAVIIVHFIFLGLTETLSLVFGIFQYIFKNIFGFIYHLNTEVLKNLFKTFCVVYSPSPNFFPFKILCNTLFGNPLLTAIFFYDNFVTFKPPKVEWKTQRSMTQKV